MTPIRRADLRNIAIIAHVDHGKTTLVDAMLRQSHVFRDNQVVQERFLDANPLERERGITILAKNTAIRYRDVKINLVDTPGHADFGGEVERVLNMVDGVLLLVDAVEGPMPQTRFVLRQALVRGHRAVVVVNKMDRANARPEWVVNNTFDLFVDLGATEEQADFEVVYTNALTGQAGHAPAALASDLEPLFQAMLNLPAPEAVPDGPLQMLVTTLDYDSYVGRIAIGRVHSGVLRRGQDVALVTPDSPPRRGTVGDVFVFENLGRSAVPEVGAGELAAVVGLPDAAIGETLTARDNPLPLPAIEVEAPTVRMAFLVNNSPFAGREGQFGSSRVLRERLYRELERNVSLKVEDTDQAEAFLVSGRGELHLAILIETMRREGYEFAVGRPEIIEREVDGRRHEPFEDAFIEVDEQHVGAVVDLLGRRRGQMLHMQQTPDVKVTSLTYRVPTRGLLGFRNQFLTATRGTGVIHTLFHDYEPWCGEIEAKPSGSLVAFETGLTTSYALNTAQERGALFVGPGVEVYVGQIVGQQPRAGDLSINVCRRKHVTNHRKSFAEDGVMLTTPVVMSLDDAIEYIGEDELVEVTPVAIRLRKKELDPEKRVKAAKKDATAAGGR
jgi:GTP-binding protein